MRADRRDRWRMNGRTVERLLLVLVVLAMSAVPARCFADGKPGDLLSQTPISGAPDGASAWKIRYRTLDEKNAPVEVTGIVILPAGPPPTGGRNVVSWGRGTVGLAPVCAPSKTPHTMFEKTPGISAMLKQGFVITASDFADPDSSRVHPYVVGLAEAHAMLDAVRAAGHMPGTGATRRYALWGESEGAHAALWSAKLAPTYAPELDLVGVAADAPPTDLIANFDAIKNPAVRALMTGYVSESWSKIYGIPLSTFANPFGRLMIRQLAKDCTRFDVPSAVTHVSLLLLSHQVPNELGDPWTKPLRENSLTAWHLTAPLLIAQGGKDDVVSPDLTRKFQVESCRQGVALRALFMPDAGHLDIAEKTTVPTVDWLAARFAGQPPESDCATLAQAGEHEKPVQSGSASASVPSLR